MVSIHGYVDSMILHYSIIYCAMCLRKSYKINTINKMIFINGENTFINIDFIRSFIVRCVSESYTLKSILLIKWFLSMVNTFINIDWKYNFLKRFVIENITRYCIRLLRKGIYRIWLGYRFVPFLRGCTVFKGCDG